MRSCHVLVRLNYGASCGYCVAKEAAFSAVLFCQKLLPPQTPSRAKHVAWDNAPPGCAFLTCSLHASSCRNHHARLIVYMRDALAMRCSLWWVGYMLGPNESYLNKGPGYLDPRWPGLRLDYP